MNISSNLFIRRAIRFVAGLLINAGALAASASIASAAVITVTTSLDQFGTGAPGECSLREAIQSANQDSDFDQCVGVGPYGNDVIVFSPTVTLVQLALTTGSNNDDNSFLDLDIRDINPPGALVIDGGPNGVTIQPGISPWNDRIFDIPQVGGQPSPVTLRNLIIQGGGPPNNETGSFPCINGGGGVRNWSGGALTLENVTIQNNAMPLSGGGVCHQDAGALTVLGSTIYNNVANGGSGGGIFYDAAGFLFIDNSTVLSNTASRSGGGIHDSANVSMTIQNSFVLSNTVNPPLGGAGGGVWTNDGNFPKQILTSTVAYNRADGDGGGIYNQTARGLQLFNSTVLSNTAGAFQNNRGNGGGIWSEQPLTIGNSQVLSNTAFYTGTSVTPPPGGGGIYHQASPIFVPPLTINNSRVAHNLARALDGFSIAGGGIWNSGIATLNNAIVEHNRADGVPGFGLAFGGGIHNENDLNLLSNSQVRHNRAEWGEVRGGGVSNENNSGGNATFTLNASSVSTNTAQGTLSAEGGGIYSGSGSTADLLAGEVRNNLAAGGQFAGGGGVASNGVLTVTSSLVISNAAAAAFTSNGGGIQTLGSAAVLITDTRIYTNTAQNGGGWYNTVGTLPGDAQLVNSDVGFNQAQQDGGGIYNTGTGVQVNSSAVRANQAITNGGGIYNGGELQIFSSQVLTNSATSGGGAYNTGLGSSMIFFGSTRQANQLAIPRANQAPAAGPTTQLAT
jgi:fibronectin-binding autotransporter adhesin